MNKPKFKKYDHVLVNDNYGNNKFTATVITRIDDTVHGCEYLVEGHQNGVEHHVYEYDITLLTDL